jgi:hypothetical protein
MQSELFPSPDERSDFANILAKLYILAHLCPRVPDLADRIVFRNRSSGILDGVNPDYMVVPLINP